GATSSVRDYYLQVSGNQFTIDRAGVLGWFDASRPAAYWCGPPDTNDTDHDGSVNPHVQKWAEAIRDADPQFNYKAFDTNPLDGALRPDELGILIVIPQNSPFGSNRNAVGRVSKSDAAGRGQRHHFDYRPRRTSARLGISVWWRTSSVIFFRT